MGKLQPLLFILLVAVSYRPESVRAQSSLYVGSNTPANTLTINSGTNSYDNTFVGFTNGGASNSLTVTDPGTLLTNSSSIAIGRMDAGNSLVVSNGGIVAAVTGTIGSNTIAANNSALVTGAGSVWANSGQLIVGQNGISNVLVVSNGGVVSSLFGRVGHLATALNNSAVITGSGSQWNNAGTGGGAGSFYVGTSGSSNNLVVSNGGVVSGTDAIMGLNASASYNVATVTGSGSLWTNSGSLSVGNRGFGNALVVSSGGVVSSAIGALGENTNSTNAVVTVTGSGSLWTNTGQFILGRRGTGHVLTLADGGTIAASNIVIASSNGSTATLDIGRFGANDAGGSISSARIAFGSGVGTINFNQSNAVTITGAISGAGTLNQRGSGTTALTGTNTYSGGTMISNGTLQVGNGGATGALGSGDVTNNATLAINRNNAYTFSNTVSGTGSLVHSGSGTTTLSGTTTYSGATTVDAGELNVNGSLNNSTVTVNSGGTLSGGGSVGGGLIIGGLLAPGNSVGTLTASNTTLLGGGSFELEVFDWLGSEGTGWDLLAVNGNLTLSNTTNSPFTINLVSLQNTNTPGLSTNWNQATSFTNKFISYTGSLLGTTFSPELFVVDSAGFLNPFVGTFGVTNVSGGLALIYTPTSSAVPEPGTWAAAALLVGAAGYVRWRKRAKVS